MYKSHQEEGLHSQKKNNVPGLAHPWAPNGTGIVFCTCRTMTHPLSVHNCDQPKVQFSIFVEDITLLVIHLVIFQVNGDSRIQFHHSLPLL